MGRDPVTGRGRFKTGRGLTFFLLRIAQFNQISLIRFLLSGRGNFYLKKKRVAEQFGLRNADLDNPAV